MRVVLEIVITETPNSIAINFWLMSRFFSSYWMSIGAIYLFSFIVTYIGY